MIAPRGEAPGSALSEADIERRTGASRTPIRESSPGRRPPADLVETMRGVLDG